MDKPNLHRNSSLVQERVELFEKMVEKPAADKLNNNRNSGANQNDLRKKQIFNEIFEIKRKNKSSTAYQTTYRKHSHNENSTKRCTKSTGDKHVTYSRQNSLPNYIAESSSRNKTSTVPKQNVKNYLSKAENDKKVSKLSTFYTELLGTTKSEKIKKSSSLSTNEQTVKKSRKIQSAPSSYRDSHKKKESLGLSEKTVNDISFTFYSGAVSECKQSHKTTNIQFESDSDTEEEDNTIKEVVSARNKESFNYLKEDDEVDSNCAEKLRLRKYDFGEEKTYSEYVEAWNKSGDELSICQINVENVDVNDVDIEIVRTSELVMFDIPKRPAYTHLRRSTSEESFRFAFPQSETLITSASRIPSQLHKYSETSRQFSTSESDLAGNSRNSYSDEEVQHHEKLTCNNSFLQKYKSRHYTVPFDKSERYSSDEEESNSPFRDQWETHSDEEDIFKKQSNSTSSTLQLNYFPNVERKSPLLGTDRQKEKLYYIIKELIDTEEKYANDLEKVVKEYKPYFSAAIPNDGNSKLNSIFGNIDELYHGAIKMYRELKECTLEPDEVGQIFIDNKDIFKRYPDYLKNKPISERLLKQKDFVEAALEVQRRLNDKLHLSAYLLTPLQRLSKYVLMLENVEKELQRKGQPSRIISEAVRIVKTEMVQGNDAVAKESIKKWPKSMPNLGSFIMRDVFDYIKPKRIPRIMLFLFENAIILTTEHSRKKETFIYIDSILIESVVTRIIENSTCLELKNYKKMKRLHDVKYSYVLDALNSKTLNKWKETIDHKLWEQLYKVKEGLQKNHFKTPASTLTNEKGRKSTFYYK